MGVDPCGDIDHARLPRCRLALRLTVDKMRDVIYCNAAGGRQCGVCGAYTVCAGYLLNFRYGLHSIYSSRPTRAEASSCNLAPPPPVPACQGRAEPLRRLTSLRRAGTSFHLTPIIHGERIAINLTPSLDCPPQMDKSSQIGYPIKID